MKPVPNSQTQLRDAIEGAATAAVVADEQGIIRLASQVAIELFGYTTFDQLIGQSIEMLIPGRYRSGHRQHMTNYFTAAASRPMGVGRDLTGLRKDGSEFAIEDSLSPLVLDDELVVAAWVRDIEDRRHLEADVSRYEAQLAHVARVAFATEMVAGIAHELSQPLAAITGYAEAIHLRLAREPHLAEEVATMTQPMIEQAVRAGQIVRSLRDFTKRQEPIMLPVSVHAVVDRAVRFLENELRMSGVSLTVVIHPDTPKVMAIEIQIAQILDNLIRNAMEALAEQPVEQRHVEVRVSHQGAEVEIEVHDSGHGFSPEAEEKAFETFFTTKLNGMGVGLAVCRSIIETHSGTIRLGRSELGGSVVSFRLPTA